MKDARRPVCINSIARYWGVERIAGPARRGHRRGGQKGATDGLVECVPFVLSRPSGIKRGILAVLSENAAGEA